MDKENERINYDEFITMFKFAPRIAYILYDKAEDEIEKITKEKDHYKHLYSEVKKQKDDVIEYVKNRIVEDDYILLTDTKMVQKDLLIMLGEINE